MSTKKAEGAWAKKKKRMEGDEQNQSGGKNKDGTKKREMGGECVRTDAEKALRRRDHSCCRKNGGEEAWGNSWGAKF